MVDESYMLINEGEKIIKPAKRNYTYHRFPAGTYRIKISHPWCIFHPATIKVFHGGSFMAEVLNTTYRDEIIHIHHEKNLSPMDVFATLGPGALVPLLAIGALIYCCKKVASNPEFQEQLRQQQEQQMKQQKEKAKAEKEKRKAELKNSQRH